MNVSSSPSLTSLTYATELRMPRGGTPHYVSRYALSSTWPVLTSEHGGVAGLRCPHALTLFSGPLLRPRSRSSPVLYSSAKSKFRSPRTARLYCILMENLLGAQLLSKSGTVATAQVLAGKNYVMIYFAGHL